MHVSWQRARNISLLFDLVHDRLVAVRHRHPVAVWVVNLNPPRVLLDVPTADIKILIVHTRQKAGEGYSHISNS